MEKTGRARARERWREKTLDYRTREQERRKGRERNVGLIRLVCSRVSQSQSAMSMGDE